MKKRKATNGPAKTKTEFFALTKRDAADELVDARLFKLKNKVYIKRKGRKITLEAITREDKRAGVTEIQEYILREVPEGAKRISAAAYDRAVGDSDEDDLVFEM